MSPSSALVQHRRPPPSPVSTIHRRCSGFRPDAYRAVLNVLAILASGVVETQSSLESFLPLRLRSRRARSSAWASRCRSPGPGAPASPGSLHPCRAARCCAAPRWPPWSRHPPRCARPSPDPPRRSRPEPSRRPPRGLHGAGARGSSTARNGPDPLTAPQSRNSRSDRESEQRHSRPRSSMPWAKAHQVHAEIAPGRHRGRAHPGRVIGPAARLGRRRSRPISTDCRRCKTA